MKESIQGWRADQILTSSAFGLESTRNLETMKLIDIYTELSVKDELSPEEHQKFSKIAQDLSLKIPSSGERKEAREAYQMIQKTLLKQCKKKSTKEREAFLKEVRAQLLELVTQSWRPE